MQQPGAVSHPIRAQTTNALAERLAMPESKFSYSLQDWDQAEVMEQPFDKARGAMQRILELNQAFTVWDPVAN